MTTPGSASDPDVLASDGEVRVERRDDPAEEDERVNRVVLTGRVGGTPVERELPSGDRVVTVRVVVPRDATVRSRSRQRSDWVDCAAWTKRLRRSVLGWQPGDVVTVEGALRRRFFRGTSGAASLVEVELTAGRRVAKGG